MSEETPLAVEQPGRNTLYIVLGVVLGVLGLLLVWFFVISPMLGGDQEEAPVAKGAATETGKAGPRLPAVTPSPKVTEPKRGELVPLESYEIFLARDPFRPVRPSAGAASPGAPGAPASPASGASPGGSPGATAGPGTATSPTPAPPGAPALGGTEGSRNVQGREVVLIDAFVDQGRKRAVVRVNGTSYTISEGETFADNFRALSIDPPCATLLYGDSAFTLCQGERVLK